MIKILYYVHLIVVDQKGLLHARISSTIINQEHVFR
jgi:hypothetical protein